jgi:hypothetical protein
MDYYACEFAILSFDTYNYNTMLPGSKPVRERPSKGH